MSNFPKVANLQIGDNVYDIKDNLDRAKYNVEKQRTLESDNTLILNKALLAEAITEKGVTTDASDTLMKMSENISMIPFGDKPAKGLLKSILCEDGAVANSVWYNYPIVYRSSGGKNITRISGGSGGYRYELTNGNENKKDSVVVTRFFKHQTVNSNSTSEAIGGQIPIIFFNALVPVYIAFFKGITNISIMINGRERIDIPFPSNETLTVNDFYIKCEVSMTSDTQCKLEFSLSAPDEDGRPTEWIALPTQYVNVFEASTDLYISMVGVGVEWYVSAKILNDPLNSTDAGDWWFKRYGNYISETCIAVKDDNDIFKVVLGASTQYPMD